MSFYINNLLENNQILYIDANNLHILVELIDNNIKFEYGDTMRYYNNGKVLIYINNNEYHKFHELVSKNKINVNFVTHYYTYKTKNV